MTEAYNEYVFHVVGNGASPLYGSCRCGENLHMFVENQNPHDSNAVLVKNEAGIALGHIKRCGVFDSTTAYALLTNPSVAIVSITSLEASSKRKVDSVKGFTIKVVTKLSNGFSV
eukprot:CAMPEP_0184993732 /NCGR_PEP_ID=MMETSP1098-20130426/46599_1 /TAXON_ID=89044 /ORGANISM="Spumella elongata, Strain CCAP 955/1" /LENGTH=114 /DNA_ID=CAMNT_0027519629 /DNA_START=254 /DNA_END=598 /DNA_ORIENTATION=+